MLLQFERNDQFGATLSLGCRRKRGISSCQRSPAAIDCDAALPWSAFDARLRARPAPATRRGTGLGQLPSISPAGYQRMRNLVMPRPAISGMFRGIQRRPRRNLPGQSVFTRGTRKRDRHPLRSMRRTGSKGLPTCPTWIFPLHERAHPHSR